MPPDPEHTSPIGRPAIRCLSCGGLEAFVSPDGLPVCCTCHKPPVDALRLTAVRSGGRLRWQPLSPPTKQERQPVPSTAVYVSARLDYFTVPADLLPRDYACPDTGRGYRIADRDWLAWLGLRLATALPRLPDPTATMLQWLRITNAAADKALITFSDFLELSSPKSLKRRLPAGYAPPVDHSNPFGPLA